MSRNLIRRPIGSWNCLRSPTADRQLELFEEYGIPARQVLPWNAYPWYINRAPQAAERESGAAVLCGLIDLLPDLLVVLLQGNDAADAWHKRGLLHCDVPLKWAALSAPRGRIRLAGMVIQNATSDRSVTVT